MKRSKVTGEMFDQNQNHAWNHFLWKATVAFDFIIQVFWKKTSNQSEKEMVKIKIISKTKPHFLIFTESNTQIWRKKSVETVFFVGFIRPCFSVSIGRISQWKSAQNSLEHIQGFGNGK